MFCLFYWGGGCEGQRPVEVKDEGEEEEMGEGGEMWERGEGRGDVRDG